MQVDPDALYQSFGKNLYRLTGEEEENGIMDMLSADSNASNAGSVQVAASDLGGGVGTATSQQASGSYQGGKQTYDNTAAGFILGVDPKDGKAKFYIGNTTKYINWDGTNLTVVGGVSVSSLDIPDVTTASSFHVDVSGNTWWGANVATGYTGANAYVLATGAAVFKNVQIGGTTIQYVITNSGIFSYGDGSDGTATFDGSATPSGSTKAGNDYTLTRDVYYTNLTMSTGTTLNPAGYRIFVSGVLTLNGTAKIFRNGNVGTIGNGPGSGIAGGPGGAALADGYLKGSPKGGDGGSAGTNAGGSGGPGGPGVATSNSLGSNGALGGDGGTDGIGGGGGGGAAGVATISNVKLIANWHLATMLDVSSTGSTVKFNNSGGSGGGGGGANGGWSGGGGGSGGGIIAIYARSVVIGASASITANGGNGGNGVGTSGLGSGCGGGGGGGNGGIVVLVYNQISNSGTITTTAGTGGSGGGGSATAGANGSGGTTYQFQLSL